MENSLKNSKSHIYNAILKHGHSNFSLTILEYCEPEQCIQREDYYLCSLPHEYNILEKAGSRLGSKHSDESKIIMSEAKKGENHPNYGKPKYKGSGTGSPPQAIEVFDNKNNTTTYYDSMIAAAIALNLPSYRAISDYFRKNQKKPYKGQYTFKKL